jgi:hypothetical protein
MKSVEFCDYRLRKFKASIIGGGWLAIEDVGGGTFLVLDDRSAEVLEKLCRSYRKGRTLDDPCPSREADPSGGLRAAVEDLAAKMDEQAAVINDIKVATHDIFNRLRRLEQTVFEPL